MKIDLDEDQNVRVVEIDKESIRSFFDGNFDLNDHEEFTTALDFAQGEVFTGEQKVSYVVIKVI